MCLAVPGKIQTVQGEDPLFRVAKVDFDGVAREVSLSCLPQAKVGDYVIVHVGVAISLLDEEEALKTLEDFQMIKQLSSGQIP
jgi:hydrogenase expression/formation protein HypC